MIARSISSDYTKWAHWYQGGSDSNIDIDNDGVMGTAQLARIDLSQALSQRLGRQMSMMATYKVNYIRIELRNVDDLNDNDSGAHFHGQIEHWSPTAHRIDAMQLARQIELADGADEPGDMFGPLDNAKTYSGLRFNWDSDGQTYLATAESFSALSGQQWDLNELFDIYNSSQSQPGDWTNALWGAGRTGQPNNLGYSVSITNKTQTETLDPGTQDSYDPKVVAYEFQPNKPIEVLGGLLNLSVTHSSVDDGDVTSIDDDYEMFITIGVEGWSDF